MGFFGFFWVGFFGWVFSLPTLVHRDLGVRVVGFVEQLKRLRVVWGARLQSGQFWSGYFVGLMRLR